MEVQLQLKFSRPFSSRDEAGIFHLLQSEAAVYGPFLAGLAALKIDNFTISPNYDLFEEDSEIEDFELSDVRLILPNSVGAEGQLLLHYLADDPDQAKAMIYAFFVENGWQPHPFTAQYSFQHDKFRQPQSIETYLRGLALLAGARAQELCVETDRNQAALKESQSQVRVQLGSLKSEMTSKNSLLEVQLASFKDQVEKSDSDRRQMRRIFFRALQISGASSGKDRTDWNKKYSTTYDHFTKQLQYKSAVELWTDRAAHHKAQATLNLKILIIVGICFALTACFVTIFGGNAIADAFVSKQCTNNPGKALACVNVFSPRGPLLISTIVLVSSLAFWLMRMLNKIYLSERHLLIDATERKAFAQTYLALREDASVTEDHEAIVLNALFRPTQDGMVQDDSPTLDASIASAIARRLAP